MSNRMSNRAEPLSVLEVHLDAVARNWLYFRKKLKNGADCAAVVKADAYGLGAAIVAPVLFDQGCRHFFVAYFDEGVDVRKSLSTSTLPGNDVDIYVLNGPWGASAADFVAHGLTPVLNSIDDIQYWRSQDSNAPAIVHIDTGMNRLGLSPDDVTNLDLSGLNIRYVMSHLACGDETAHPKNAEQLAAFKTLTTQLGLPLRLSLANSAGIMLGTDYHFDLVRPGCGLYGINPWDGVNPMQGAVTLKARVVQIREIKKAGTVGYGASYSVAPPAKCATVSVGYADGYLRSATGQGQVVIDGHKCPIIGRVSMDSVIVDVSHTNAQTGDWAEIIGQTQTVDDVAAQARTIGYEILTNLGRRYKRIYTGA